MTPHALQCPPAVEIFQPVEKTAEAKQLTGQKRCHQQVTHVTVQMDGNVVDEVFSLHKPVNVQLGGVVEYFLCSPHLEK